MRPGGVLETVLYALDLSAARQFYEMVLGLECFAAYDDRQAFFYCGDQVLLIFNPDRTEIPRPPGPGIPPPHGARGPGHVCFRAGRAEIDRWRDHLQTNGIAIEADFVWDSGGRSIYVRDPAGNSVEFAEPRIWGLPRKTRTLRSEKLVVASHNPGKRKEIEELLAPFGVIALSAAELGLPESDETGATFIENARIKAQAAAEASGYPAIADDSGLCVDALGGDPGIYSARWAGEGKDFELAMRIVEDKLKAAGAHNLDRRGAHFVSALCVTWPDGETRCYEGRADGTVVWPPRGRNGFGYDPIFLPEGLSQTFGEMEPAAKHALSHRARAFEKLVNDLL